MSKGTALNKWFGDAEKAKQLEERVANVEKEIEDSGIKTRTEEGEVEEELDDTQEGEEVEDEEVVDVEELVFELDEATIGQIAGEVGAILEARLGSRLDEITERITQVESLAEVVEDIPKQQKIRLKMASMVEPEKTPIEEGEESKFTSSKKAVATTRSSNLVRLREKAKQKNSTN